MHAFRFRYKLIRKEKKGGQNQDDITSPECVDETVDYAPLVSIDDAGDAVSLHLDQFQEVLLKLDREKQEKKALQLIDEVVTAIGAHKDATEVAVNSCLYVMLPQHSVSMM